MNGRHPSDGDASAGHAPVCVDPIRVDPIGIVRYPEDYHPRPRQYGSGIRAIAAVLLGVFFTVVVVSTGVSLGAYCLTSDGANFSHLLPWLAAE